MSTFFRILIGVTALGLAAIHFAAPDIKIDITFFVLVAIGLLMLFAPGIRIKALEWMGLKVEFEKQEQQPPTAAAPAQNAVGAVATTLGKPASYGAGESYGYSGGDNYSVRVAKLTPSEILAPYVIVTSLTGNLSKANGVLGPYTGWIIFGFFLVLTPLYYWRVLNAGARFELGVAHKWLISQTTLSTISFAAWAFALGGPFTALSWYNPSYGALALTIVTFLIPVVYAPSVSNE
jgi:hypothetical protein